MKSYRLELSSSGRCRIATKLNESKSTLIFDEAWDSDTNWKISSPPKLTRDSEKQRVRLADDDRVRIQEFDDFVVVTIPDTERRDAGKYAINVANDSGLCNVPLKVKVIAPPLPPTGPFEISNVSKDRATLSWKPPKDDGDSKVTGYVVERGDTSKGADALIPATQAGKETTFTVPSLLAEHEYDFRVMAINENGTSEPLRSTASTTTKLPFKPASSPGQSDITGMTNNTATLNWKKPTSDGGGGPITSYWIEKREGNIDKWISVNMSSCQSTHFTVPSLVEDHIYEFCVTAENEARKAAPSNTTKPTKVKDPNASTLSEFLKKLKDDEGKTIKLECEVIETPKPDVEYGLTFSSSLQHPWKFIIEVPFSNTCQITPTKHFEQMLPVLSILSSKTLTEVTYENYQLFIGEEEELVARFLKAYESQTIDCLSQKMYDSDDDKPENDEPVDFDPLVDDDESRQYIYECLNQYVSDLPRNKIFQLSFTKFLYRRVRFFTGYYYRYNSSIPNLGSIAISQMIEEAKYLTQADFSSDDYHRIYLVYDPYFALHLLHNDWDSVPYSLKRIFKDGDPKREIIEQGRNYYIECLAWLIDIKYDIFETIMKETKFILTENFAYKLFHIHERKLTKLPLIIEGETGVGKTFLLKFYSSLLNAHISHGDINSNTTPKIRERTSLWLRNKIIIDIIQQHSNFLNVILPKLAPKLNEFDNNLNENNIYEANLPYLINIEDDEPERDVLTEIKQSLQTYEYDHNLLKIIWKTIVTVAATVDKSLSEQLIKALCEFVKSQLKNLPLIEASYKLENLLKNSNVLTMEKSIEIFDEFLVYTQIKSVFYRLLLHPGINEEKLVEFISPICELAIRVQNIELVVFFDEVNTSSCLGLFKEMFMDGTLHGKIIPKNIFFTAAINPSKPLETISNSYDQETFHVHRSDYLVHQLPESLENLKIIYGILNRNTLEDYIMQKIDTFTISSLKNPCQSLPLEKYAQDMLMRSILNAQDFCEKHLGRNSVSQREIQRCFNLIDFFWKLKYNNDDEPDASQCIALSLALIYYFRLPTKEDKSQRNDTTTPSREDLGDVLDRTLPDFCRTVQDELENFVNTENFSIPAGVAVNQAIREHIFAIVVSVATRTPLCIIGAPGQSKTLSFQIVLQNLQGPQLSTTSFCQRLLALDPFFCLGSKYSRSEDIAYVFDRAIKREEQYQKIRIDRRCVVFLDEASLPDENKMVLKVLHPYLDGCQVSFIAIANKSFDAANANRMICVYRSLPSQIEQQVLAYGCLGLPFDKKSSHNKNDLDNIIIGLCDGYRELLLRQDIPNIFHDRDFIYMLRELRFELSAATSTNNDEIKLNGIQPNALLRALEDNFNGINQDQFKSLIDIFFKAVQNKSLRFRLPTERPGKKIYRDVPTILHESMKLDSKRRRLYGRYKLVIDESEDESAIHLLLQAGILDADPNRTTVFRMSDFVDDIDNELNDVEILSSIKLCMEMGKTILMVNTSRIHDSLYDVFNQNFSIMATGDTRKIFSKVSIGAKTIDVVVHENFQCIVHVKRNELQTIPAPFLSRFQKYSLSINDFYRIRLQKLSKNEQDILKYVASKAQSFIVHFGREYFYSLNDNTLYSCLLSLIEMKSDGKYSLYPISHHYTQLSRQMNSFIEINHCDIQKSLLRIVLMKLIQLVSPESIILKLRTFEDKFAQWLSNVYFHEQEHFNIENFLQRLISNTSETIRSNGTVDNDRDERKVFCLTKLMIFTRTSSYILSMNQRSKQSFIRTNYRNDQDNILHADSKIVEILNLSIIENSSQLKNKFDEFRSNLQKIIFIITINTHFDQQRLHIPYIRQLIDSTEYAYNVKNAPNYKYFLMLIHSPAQDLYHQSCFPSIFLHNWDFYFFDTCATGSAFYLQKLLQLLSPNHELEVEQDNTFCDLNVLFEDCLWAFCSRIQILAPKLPRTMFRNTYTYEFYQCNINTIRKVKCLREILGESSELQKLLVNIYHQHLLTTKNSSKKIYDFIYQISKDILCGKRFDGLVESIQMETRHSFMNFVLNIFKIIVNNYGLETVYQLSNNRQIYGPLLNLIDFHSFVIENDNDNMFASQTKQDLIHFTTNYSCIPQTPLFHLFHQRIRSHANVIKSKYIHHNQTIQSTEQNRNSEDDSSNDFSNITTTSNNPYNDDDMTSLTFERFRYELLTFIKNDKILSDSINSITVYSYSKDLVSTSCAIIENNFDYDPIQYQQTVEFISRWLSLNDQNDCQLNTDEIDQNIWFLVHIYTTFEYEQTDLLSMYTACRIMHRFQSTQSPFIYLFSKQSVDRSELREIFFRSIFDQLWSNLCQLSSDNKENYKTWIYTYTFISKYYPSEKVLRRMQLIEIKCQIQLMNLIYLLFLNEKIYEPQNLVTNLLEKIQLNPRSDCLLLLPKIIDVIQEQNLDNSTWMIDMQQWIISICKSSQQPSEETLRFLLIYLNQSTTYLSLPMKQFLFDQLIELLSKTKDDKESKSDLWNHFSMISILIECVSNVDHYQIPFHPLIETNDQYEKTQVLLFDLYFFHLRNLLKYQNITIAFLNKGMLLKLSKIDAKEKKIMAENLFEQLKNYFLSVVTALLIINIESDQANVDAFLNALSTLMHDLFFIDSTTEYLPNYLKLFLSTIISKRSWDYLFNFLRSEKLRIINKDWTTTLYRLLQLNETDDHNSNLQLSHQIQFTFSMNGNKSSIFSNLHQPYEQLRTMIKTSIQKYNDENSWEELISWMRNLLDCEHSEIHNNQFKAMLLLNIYYDYYCTNRLESIRPLINILQESSFFSEKELSVFRALVDPEQYIIGYNSPDNTNSINKLFNMNCQTEFEVSLRHVLVNLMAMILSSGARSFLWTFVFDPLTLEKTYGFGSTYQSTIERNGLHYDCGCVISQDGVLERPLSTRDDRGLSVPAVYVAYFSTFGALAWHLLLCDDSVDNLCGPVLSPWAINTTADEHHETDQNMLTKICHFVYARLLSTFHFLSVQLNHDDACLLLTRCFEQMAYLTKCEQEWIQPVYTTFNEKQNAEQEFEKNVFYFVFNKLVDYKADINQRVLQSQIQVNLQKFTDQMPLVLDFQHFQTALHHSKTRSSSDFRLLRFILDSFNILKVTKIIIPLAQFYLLLHQTYIQLIKSDELLTLSLKELYERAEKCSDQFYNSFNQNEKENHRVIIQDGIDAVNNYHKFAYGLIQPGVCNQTQRFEKIDFDTPVNYLLTTNNSDEGNIIMRILSILVNYHNHILKLLSIEMNTNKGYENSILKFLVNDITSKEISILQVVSYGIGIILLDDQDCKWIERLCQASITSDEQYAFINVNSLFTFDFGYIQSQIIHIYLLFCQINHHHIIQTYQCYTEQLSTNLTITDNENLDLDEKYMLPFNDEQLDYEWNYLKSISLDNLYHSYTLLKQIASTLKTSLNDINQSDSLFDFLHLTDQDNDILERIQHCGTRDFPLCHFNHVIKLYAQSINGFEHLFTDISPLLRIPIDTQLDIELTKQFNEQILHTNNDNNIEKYQTMNQTITEFLNDLKNSKDLILQQSSQSFVETCHHLSIDNPILKWIPSEIRCENYVPLNIHLIRIRSILQETKVNVEEKMIILWQEETEIQRNDIDGISESEETNDQSNLSSLSSSRQNSTNEKNSRSSSLHEPEISDFEEFLVYDSLFQFDIKLVPCSSFTFLQQLHEHRTERITEPAAVSNAPKFIVTLPDGKPITIMCKLDKWQARLKKIFDDKHYDYNEFALIDENEIFVDLNMDNFILLQKSPAEYRIVKKESLVSVKFHFRSSEIEYVTTTTNQIGTIIKHFIDNIQSNSITNDTYLGFRNQYGEYIEDVSVGNLYNNNDKKVDITVIEKTFENNTLWEISLNELKIFLDLESTWEHVEKWLKDFCRKNDISINDYAFLLVKERIIFKKTESIGSTIDTKQLNLIDVINQQTVTSITLSYENKHESLQILTSMKVIQLLRNNNLREKLDINENTLKNFMMILEKENECLTLSEEQMQQTIETYCSTTNNLLHFRLFIPTTIVINYNEEKISLVLQTRNITIREILQMMDESMIVRRCLALKKTKRVLHENEILSDLSENEFYLIDKKDICRVCIGLSEVNINQCFTNNATINDMCKELKINLETQHVMYSNEIILSSEISLSCFQSETPVCFSITETNFPIRITVNNDQQHKSITFYCNSSITIERLCSLCCHLMCVIKDTAELTLPDGTTIDNEISLMDINDTMTEIELQLIAAPCLSCSITCSDRTIVLPCRSDQLISTLVNNLLEQLSISSDLMETYTLFALDTEETEIDFDISIEDIKGLFSSSSSSIISVELRK
ncbi:unnamed protein product [Adineta steineri]|uniref:Fibronectin type-III domain-containing protein n=2 Tax=Adineta steineri TaxID=433720 RepID=A0A814NN52_9BILA|nr:unnamed protein product [Adineta steineri]